MKKLLNLFMVMCLLALVATSAQAIEVLQNGNLDDPGIHENDAVASWTLDERVTAANTPGENPATMASFADHTTATPDGVGLWLRAFEGLFVTGGNGMEPVDAILSQIVPGTPGNRYTFSGWSRWEGGYSGGVTTLSPNAPGGARPSPTGTFMEMRFLNAANAGISGVLIDLRTQQMNDGMWRQHSISATAPPGTVNILATAYALDMVPNVNMAPGGQSAFFDDFSLDCVPEPTSMVLGLIALAGFLGLLRRR